MAGSLLLYYTGRDLVRFEPGAIFSLSRLRLETASNLGDRDAMRVLVLRQPPNFTLATILWAKVAINVLLTLFADSLLTGPLHRRLVTQAAIWPLLVVVALPSLDLFLSIHQAQ